MDKTETFCILVALVVMYMLWTRVGPASLFSWPARRHSEEESCPQPDAGAASAKHATVASALDSDDLYSVHKDNRADFDKAYGEVVKQMPSIALGPRRRLHARETLGVQTTMDEPNLNRDRGLELLVAGRSAEAEQAKPPSKSPVGLFTFNMPNALQQAVVRESKE